MKPPREAPGPHEAIVASPVGLLRLVGSDEALQRIDFLGPGGEAPRVRRGLPDAIAATVAQLSAYFDGTLRTFDLPLAPSGSPFQRDVWEALRAIPFGETTTYGAIARVIGRPDAVRAVGAANGANPIPIVIPCHRVVGSDGSLTGYGGGLDIKRALLALEGVVVDAERQRALFAR